MGSITQDCRLALRSLRKSHGFTAAVVLTLALGIGANTAVFSIVYSVLLRPLPYPEPERLVGLVQTQRESRWVKALTHVQFRFLTEHERVFESVAAWTPVGSTLATATEADRVVLLLVSRDYFRVLGVAPQLGRDFVAEEDQPGATSAIILSHGLWQQRFGSDPRILGRTVSLDGRPASVVGVMPSGFRSFPPAEAWGTLAQVGSSIGGGSNLGLIGRLRRDLTLPQARAAVMALGPALQREFARSFPPETGLDLEPYQAQLTAGPRKTILILFGAIGFVMLIACANVANLMLGRAAARSRELAVRVALGASRGRLMRQLLAESLLLAVLGGAVGLLFAGWGLSLVLTLVADTLPSGVTIRLDGWALGFTLVLSLITGLVFGLAPAWRASRTDPHGTLQERSPRAAGATRRGALRHGLVVGEIALSLVLLVGAGLLIRTFANLIRTDPGFDPRNVVSVEFWPAGSRYDSTLAIASFYRDLAARVEAIPGVQAAAVIEAGLPLQRGGNTPVAVDGENLRETIDYRTVTPGFFRTLRIAVRQGRDFTETDATGGAPVAIVNQAFARRFLADRGSLGRSLQLTGYDDTPRHVVGVVGDMRSYIDAPAPPTVFLPSAQTPADLTKLFANWFPAHVVVGTAGDPAAVQAGLAHAIHEVDPLIPVGRVRAMDEVLSESLAVQRFVMVLLSVFAGLAIVLAAVGIFGVISYIVAQRTQEIGVRMALGAQTRDVVRMVLARGIRLAAIGTGLGLLGAFGLTRLLANQLYEVRPSDPVTYAGVTALLVLVALAGSYLPARRATRVDPVTALRVE